MLRESVCHSHRVLTEGRYVQKLATASPRIARNKPRRFLLLYFVHPLPSVHVFLDFLPSLLPSILPSYPPSFLSRLPSYPPARLPACSSVPAESEPGHRQKHAGIPAWRWVMNADLVEDRMRCMRVCVVLARWWPFILACMHSALTPLLTYGDFGAMMFWHRWPSSARLWQGKCTYPNLARTLIYFYPSWKHPPLSCSISAGKSGLPRSRRTRPGLAAVSRLVALVPKSQAGLFGVRRFDGASCVFLVRSTHPCL